MAKGCVKGAKGYYDQEYALKLLDVLVGGCDLLIIIHPYNEDKYPSVTKRQESHYQQASQAKTLTFNL